MIVKEYEWWKIYGWSCRQKHIAQIEWCPGFYCFIMGMLFDGRLYTSSFISGAVYVLRSIEIQFSMCRLTESGCVIFFSPLISYGSSLDIGYKKKRNCRFFHFILCQLEMERPCGIVRTLAQLTAACMGGRLELSSSPPLWEEEKRQLQLYRRSHRR